MSVAILLQPCIYTVRQLLRSSSPNPLLEPSKLSIKTIKTSKTCLVSIPGQYLRVSFVTHANLADYPVLLNNLLQGHRATEHFRYEMTREGPEDNVTHIATAICEHHVNE